MITTDNRPSLGPDSVAGVSVADSLPGTDAVHEEPVEESISPSTSAPSVPFSSCLLDEVDFSHTPEPHVAFCPIFVHPF